MHAATTCNCTHTHTCVCLRLHLWVRSRKVAQKYSNCDAHVLIHGIPNADATEAVCQKSVRIRSLFDLHRRRRRRRRRVWQLAKLSHVCLCVSGNGIACVLIKNIRKTLFIWQMSLSHFVWRARARSPRRFAHGEWVSEWDDREGESTGHGRGVCRRIRETPNAFEWQIELSHINNVERDSMSARRQHSTLSRVYLLAENRFFPHFFCWIVVDVAVVVVRLSFCSFFVRSLSFSRSLYFIVCPHSTHTRAFLPLR